MNLIAKDQLRQRHVDRFFGEMRKLLPSWRSVPMQEAAGAYVRSGVAAGMVVDLSAPVDEMTPQDVLSLAVGIDEILAEALTIPNA
jgi:hypothetical protein